MNVTVNDTVKEMLETASDKAIKLVAVNRAYHAQLALIDKKTKLICFRFLTDEKLEPVERELLSDDLVRLQEARQRVVQEVLNLNII